MSVATEIETKFAVSSFDSVRRALERAGGERLSRLFEENVVLDTPDGALRRRGVLLRLRRDGAGKVTLKLPAEAPRAGGLKARREMESEVADMAAMEAIFAVLGFGASMRYEKVRETWRLEDSLVCLDELPFGLFLEIEGTAEAIPRLAARLGLSMDQAMDLTYHDLHQAHCRKAGLPPSDSFVFPPEIRRAILARLDTA